METVTLEKPAVVMKKIALVAHDNAKRDLIEWVEWNWSILIDHQLICTGTTGRLVEEALKKKMNPETAFKHEMIKLKSGPLGGDQQLGALIAEGRVDLIVFFWDPMQPQPHDVDVKALLRIAVLYNVPIACNRSTADFVISSPLLNLEYRPIIKDYGEYLSRVLDS
jgi:methylglyoxal synthase